MDYISHFHPSGEIRAIESGGLGDTKDGRFYFPRGIGSQRLHVGSLGGVEAAPGIT
jgi:hypothetical protein